MTRVPYDQASKKLLDGALADAGRVELQREVTSEPQWIDAWFEPEAGAPRPPGLLGRMVESACAFEVFHDRPSVEQVLRCLGKHLALHDERLRKREQRAATPPLAPMWIVSAGRPTKVLRRVAFSPLAGWPPGVYRMAVMALPVHAVVASELPRTRATLTVRLMGAGRALSEAMVDLAALPPGAWERRVASDAVRVLHSCATEGAVWRDPEEEAVIVSASQAYEEIKQEGRQEGVLEGERRLLLRMLERRFGAIPSAVLARIQAADASELESWAERVVDFDTLDEVLAR